MHFAFFGTSDDDMLAISCGRVVVARILDLIGSTDTEPLSSENCLLFEFEEFIRCINHWRHGASHRNIGN